MQYSVPQFTDVEDKIIGPLSFKQFGIIFGGGALIFVFYSLTKSTIVLILSAIIFGLPTLFLAFGKINGRPIYKSFSTFIQFFTRPRMMLFHKEGVDPTAKVIDKTVEISRELHKTQAQAQRVAPGRLHELNYQLQQQEQKEAELSHQYKQ